MGIKCETLCKVLDITLSHLILTSSPEREVHFTDEDNGTCLIPQQKQESHASLLQHQTPHLFVPQHNTTQFSNVYSSFALVLDD